MNANRTNFRAQILTLLKSGKSQKEICSKTGASHKLIRAVINEAKFNYVPKRGKVTAKKEALILEKYHEGKNDGEIASEIEGITKRMVGNTLCPFRKKSNEQIRYRKCTYTRYNI